MLQQGPLVGALYPSERTQGKGNKRGKKKLQGWPSLSSRDEPDNIVCSCLVPVQSPFPRWYLARGMAPSYAYMAYYNGPHTPEALTGQRIISLSSRCNNSDARWRISWVVDRVIPSIIARHIYPSSASSRGTFRIHLDKSHQTLYVPLQVLQAPPMCTLVHLLALSR